MVIQIWKVKFKNTEEKFLEANGIDDAMQKAIDWSQIQFDECKKELGKKFDDVEIADDYLIESLSLFVETDIEVKPNSSHE